MLAACVALSSCAMPAHSVPCEANGPEHKPRAAVPKTGITGIESTPVPLAGAATSGSAREWSPTGESDMQRIR